MRCNNMFIYKNTEHHQSIYYVTMIEMLKKTDNVFSCQITVGKPIFLHNTLKNDVNITKV